MTLPPSLQRLIDERSALWAPEDVDRHFSVALTRRAWVLEAHLPEVHHHESMEWLGDRVLGAVVAAYLWRRFPHAEPGRLDLVRDQLTSAPALAKIARDYQLVDSISMGVGERQQGQANSDKVLSDHIEALVGAAFLCGGWPGATYFVERLLEGLFPSSLPGEEARRTGVDGPQALTALNHAVQARWKQSLAKHHWECVRLPSPDHAQEFYAEVFLPDGSMHRGATVRGTQQEAKANAARVALEFLRQTDEAT